jgi:hypothetical protein
LGDPFRIATSITVADSKSTGFGHSLCVSTHKEGLWFSLDFNNGGIKRLIINSDSFLMLFYDTVFAVSVVSKAEPKNGISFLPWKL